MLGAGSEFTVMRAVEAGWDRPANAGDPGPVFGLGCGNRETRSETEWKRCVPLSI